MAESRKITSLYVSARMLNVVQTNAADDKHVTHDCFEDGLTKMPDNVDKMRKQLCGPFTV